MAIVYMATNKLNGCRYVGATVRSLKQRRRGHESDARKASRPCRLFHGALAEFGPEAFEWEILTICQEGSELWKAEIKFIEALKPEYNIARGGQGVKAQRKGTIENRPIICLNDKRLFETNNAAVGFYGISKNTIKRSCQQGGRRGTMSGLEFCFLDEWCPNPE